MYSHLKEKLRPKIVQLLATLTEISYLIYQEPDKRSPKQVLRLYNTTFLHSILCKDIIGLPKKLTVFTRV